MKDIRRSLEDDTQFIRKNIGKLDGAQRLFLCKASHLMAHGFSIEETLQVIAISSQKEGDPLNKITGYP